MSSFACQTCGTSFEVPAKTLAKYPGWKPRFCREHSPKQAKAKSRPAGLADEGMLAPDAVLAKFQDPGQDGLFTDGSCHPNPGPGGWGVVWVEGGRVRDARHGYEGGTTNNRMELRALIEAYRMLPEDAAVVVHSDSNLCVQTVTTWAKGWAARGWKRKEGPIANLDLVRELYDLSLARPRVELRWIRAHAGHRWNEYADSLANTWRRDGPG